VGHLPMLVGQRGPPSDADGRVYGLAACLAREGRMIYVTSRHALLLCAGACGGTAMTLFLRVRYHLPGLLLARFFAEAEVWRVAGLFKAKLASVDRRRVGE
jgi:hypothetical protein